jgi:hypothetical protein
MPGLSVARLCVQPYIRPDRNSGGTSMIGTLLAMLLAPAQPVTTLARPVSPQPGVQAATLQGRKQRLVTDSRALLEQAERLNANYAPAPGKPSKAEIDASIDQMKSDLDSMSEMGETESLRLQMAMDRLSKMMSTLSNLLKKASDTDQGIVQNIK